MKIVQPPTRMEFGYTCTALDPDGHRLRVFAPA
jgi:predicted enzyme related to lactoylglutathione lyase